MKRVVITTLFLVAACRSESPKSHATPKAPDATPRAPRATRAKDSVGRAAPSTDAATATTDAAPFSQGPARATTTTGPLELDAMRDVIERTRERQRPLVLAVLDRFPPPGGDDEAYADWSAQLNDLANDHPGLDVAAITLKTARALLAVPPPVEDGAATVFVRPGGEAIVYRGRVLEAAVHHAAIGYLAGGALDPSLFAPYPFATRTTTAVVELEETYGAWFPCGVSESRGAVRVHAVTAEDGEPPAGGFLVLVVCPADLLPVHAAGTRVRMTLDATPVRWPADLAATLPDLPRVRATRVLPVKP